ncbi:hypothetical protein RN607_09035 [Demequina capsici]|uniref:Uncharacterized protein n=1 Tax=Demequina capsici TaxID=3075620 RepID=A0AA96F3Y4_9MICO|nr:MULTISPECIES: hypothetical protein [unclassified Demequina]WNM23467.1 hypothetical protein RN606_08810 [Demequina sp. OYTSA14]WNM26344.1 hypothetical protein RN607_09035 [Demequina sp. PMTSA13]
MSVSRLLWTLGGLLATGVVGLSMMFWALERTVLLTFADGSGSEPPVRIYVILFLGLSATSLSGFYSLLHWSRFLRENPGTSQAPIWLLAVVGGLAASALLTAIATHAAYIRSLSVVPVDPNQGYVAFQVVMGALIGACTVLAAARWAPGYKHAHVNA